MKKSINNQIAVNKHPYFLWSTYVMETATIDEEKKILYGEEKSSHYRKANPLIILLLKYLPLLILMPFIAIPDNIQSFIFFCVALFLVAVFVTLYNKDKILYLRIFLLLLIVGIAAVAIVYPEINIENTFFELLHYIGISLLVYIVLMDFYKKDYKNFYKLEDIKKDVQGKLVPAGNRKFMKIPFTKRSMFSYKVKEDFRISFFVGGYYFTMINKKEEK